MISFIRGTLLSVEENKITIEVHGIGYEIIVPPSMIRNLPSVGQEFEVYTHLHVREECLQLYGFSTVEDRALFLILLKIPGIGPRAAMTIVGTYSPRELSSIINNGNSESLLRIPGIGKKSAQRIILELKGKLQGFNSNESGCDVTDNTQCVNEVSDALLALGYGRHKVEEVLKKIIERESTGFQASELLRSALKELGKRKKE